MLPLSHATKLETLNAPTVRRILEAYGFFAREIGPVRMIMERIHPESVGSPEQRQVRESVTADDACWINRVTRVLQ